jgi:hypothetical protein
MSDESCLNKMPLLLSRQIIREAIVALRFHHVNHPSHDKRKYSLTSSHPFLAIVYQQEFMSSVSRHNALI